MASYFCRCIKLEKKKFVLKEFATCLLGLVSRTTTTVLKAVTPASCATATLSALSPELATEKAGSVSVKPVSSAVSVIAATTRSLRSLLTAVKVRTDD